MIYSYFLLHNRDITTVIKIRRRREEEREEERRDDDTFFIFFVQQNSELSVLDGTTCSCIICTNTHLYVCGAVLIRASSLFAILVMASSSLLEYEGEPSDCSVHEGAIHPAGVANTKYSHEPDQSLCARIVNAMKRLAVSSASIYLAIALSRFLSYMSFEAGSLFEILILFALVSISVSRLNFILSVYSNSPNKIWILSSACGHAVAFLYRYLIINLAEVLKIVELGYAAIVLYCVFTFVFATLLLYNHKIVLEKKERKAEKSKNRKQQKCCCGLCPSVRGHKRWSMRRRLRFVLASSESMLDGMSILFAFMLSALLKMSYNLHHAIAEHNPCQEVQWPNITSSHVKDDASSHKQTNGLAIVMLVLLTSYFLVVPGTRYLLQRCRRNLPMENAGTFVYMQRQTSQLLDNSLIFFLAWTLLLVFGISLKLWKLGYMYFTNDSVSIETGTWIDFLIIVLLSIYMMCRASNAKRKKSVCNHPRYISLISSTNQKIACILVGVTFEEALICTFLDESSHMDDEYLPLKQAFFFLLAFVIFGIVVKCFGTFIATEMELEVDEMLQCHRKETSQSAATIYDSNNLIDDGNDRMEHIRISESFSNADEVLGIPDNIDVELASNNKGSGIPEDEDAFSYQEIVVDDDYDE